MPIGSISDLTISHSDVEDLLAEREIIVSYEPIRYWCIKFCSIYSRRLKHKHQGFGDVFLQKSRNAIAAKRFFKRLFKTNKGKPRKIVTDKLASYGIAHQELSPDVIHDKSQYANNLSKLSRVHERVTRRFKSLDRHNDF